MLRRLASHALKQALLKPQTHAMADDAAPSSPKKMKKLPFKPTALRKTSQLKLASSDDDTKGDDDGLALFRRSKEMEPIVAADRERRLKKKQKQEEERRRRTSVAMGKRPLGDDDDERAPHEDTETQHETSPLGRRQDELARDVFSTDASLTTDDGPSFRFAELLVFLLHLALTYC